MCSRARLLLLGGASITSVGLIMLTVAPGTGAWLSVGLVACGVGVILLVTYVVRGPLSAKASSAGLGAVLAGAAVVSGLAMLALGALVDSPTATSVGLGLLSLVGVAGILWSLKGRANE
jgi:hypothetical protein